MAAQSLQGPPCASKSGPGSGWRPRGTSRRSAPPFVPPSPYPSPCCRTAPENGRKTTGKPLAKLLLSGRKTVGKTAVERPENRRETAGKTAGKPPASRRETAGKPPSNLPRKPPGNRWEKPRFWVTFASLNKGREGPGRVSPTSFFGPWGGVAIRRPLFRRNSCTFRSDGVGGTGICGFLDVTEGILGPMTAFAGFHE